jgi:uncharacterized membrane protein YfcA
MTVLELALFVGAGSVAAGFLGSLTGLGGGIVVVPMLTLLFHVDMRYAIGASLICVIATSSGAAAAYVREGYTNIRIGMLLEVATTAGALLGASIAGFIPTSALAILFGLVLLFTAYRSLRHADDVIVPAGPDPLARRLRLDGSYPVDGIEREYGVHRVPLGFALMFVAGVVSALLGIGSGVLKVLAMDHVMALPYKVSATTSNFMIGVTAAASAGVYLHRGYVNPTLVFPVMLGVLSGALLGARVLPRARTVLLRRVFTVLMVLLALEMLYQGLRNLA